MVDAPMQAKKSRSPVTVVILALVPPASAIVLLACSSLLRDYLANAFVLQGRPIPETYDPLQRFLLFAPILLSLFGVVNGLIFLAKKPYKLLTSVGILLSFVALFASCMMGVR